VSASGTNIPCLVVDTIRRLPYAGLAAVALLAFASAASAAPAAPQLATPAPQELSVACSSPLIALAVPNTAGKCAPGQKLVSLVPGPTSLCVVPILEAVYLASVTGGCVRPFTALTVPSTTANEFLPGPAQSACARQDSEMPAGPAGLRRDGTTSGGQRRGRGELWHADRDRQPARQRPPRQLPATCDTPNDDFTYTLTDGYGRASSASLTITLSRDQAAPTADSVSVALSSSSPSANGNLIVSGFVTTTDGDPVSLTSVKFGSSALSLVPANLVLPDGTDVAVAADGDCTVTAQPGFFTTCSSDAVDSGTYTVTGAFGQSATASLTFDLTCPPQADLSISMADNAGGKSDPVTTEGTVVPGSTIIYTVVVSNAGPNAAVGATVSDNFPAALAGVSWTASATAGASAMMTNGTGSINDTVNLASGSSITFTIHATVISSATGTLSNTATVTPPSSVSDRNTADETSTDTDALTPEASLEIVNTDGQTDPLSPNGPLTYTIVVTNTGPSDATGLSVADSTGLEGVMLSSGPYLETFSSGAFTWTIGKLAAGADVTLQLSGTVPSTASGTFSSTATASADDATNVSSTAANAVDGS
jgi:uncharacterized repeat protein (TIGR01451 family)